MEQRRVGDTDIQVSVITLGTWPMGGDYFVSPGDDVSIRTIREALDLGVTCFDTASLYGKGHAETVLGQGLLGRRHEAIIASKAWRTELAPAALRQELEGSLKRLQTDYIDVYFLHYPDPTQSIAGTMEMMETLRSEGKIRAIGVSNFSAARMERASRYGKIDALQPPYNMIWRYIEREELPYCREHNAAVFTYSSLAQGLLTGALSLDTDPSELGERRAKSALFAPENYGRILDMVDKLRPIAERTGLTLSQLALRWVLQQPGVTTALVGACSPVEIGEDCGAVGTIPPDVMAEIQRLSDELYHSLPDYAFMWNTDLKGEEPEQL